MRPHAVASLAFATIAASGVCAAAPAACSGPNLRVLVPPGPKWQSAAMELAEHLKTLTDLDLCAYVSVQPASDGQVALDVVTGDGRSATRHISSVPELLRSAEALLILPPETAASDGRPTPDPAETSRSESGSIAPAMSPSELPPPEPARSERGARRAPLASSHAEFGVGAALRLGGGPFYAGGGALAFAQFVQSDWLLAVSARWDAADAVVTEPVPRDFYMTSGALGFGAGRRFVVGTTRLDALIGPNLVLEIQDADDVNREVHEATADFRFGFALRASSARSASLQPFAGTDFEASPSRAHRPRSLDSSLPTLPWWSAGAVVGVLWGVE